MSVYVLMCLVVCVSVRAYVRACVRACVCAPEGTESEKDGAGKGHNVPVIAQPGRKSPLMVCPLEGISQMPPQAGEL